MHAAAAPLRPAAAPTRPNRRHPGGPVIIDAYNNVWEATGTSDYLTAEEFSAGAMLADMDTAGVDMAVGCSLGQAIDNDFIARAVAAYPDRLIGFGQVTPRAQDAVGEVERIA